MRPTARRIRMMERELTVRQIRTTEKRLTVRRIWRKRPMIWRQRRKRENYRFSETAEQENLILQ